MPIQRRSRGWRKETQVAALPMAPERLGQIYPLIAAQELNVSK